MKKVKTLCVNCEHFKVEGTMNRHIWYNHFCTNPDLQRIEEVNPVTGKSGFVGKNDLGTMYFTDESSPHCRDINHGNCEYFSDRKIL